MTPTQLAARCEAAEGPSFALEQEIARAVGFDLREELGGAISRPPPRYTTSIDAALTLVPEGLYPTIDFVRNRCWLRTSLGYDVPSGPAFGNAKTVPLALAAAALKARA